MPDFSSYLESVRRHYEQWWKGYAFIDEIDELTWFDFPLSSTTKDKPQKPGEQPTDTPPQLVLEAIHDYAREKILIAGPPGAGKSTLLANIFQLAAVRAIEDEQAPIPVLIELRDYKAGGDRSGLRGLILQTLESHDPSLDEENLKKLLKKGQLLLLVDGLNEKPEAQRDLKAFCRNIPLIATSRQNGDGWDIERKLELQPLSTEQVKEFFELQLPNADRKQLQTLGDRVRDVGQTPLMVWMLYSIFRANKDVPETRGEAYRSFTALYSERAKDGVDLSDSRSLLGKLAFEMMRSKKVDDPTDFSLKILEVDAPNVLGSEVTLKRMLNHLLKQQGKAGNREISFCHQSLQEYYAAEYLLEQVKNLDNDSLQQEYLNYLKWTEPVALMLGLIKNDEDLAVRVVELALDVDLMLGARLAGKVRSGFQENIDRLVNTSKIPSWLKNKISQFQSSPKHSFSFFPLDYVVPIQKTSLKELLELVINPNSSHDDVWSEARALHQIQNPTDHNIIIPALLKMLENPNSDVRWKAAVALGQSGSFDNDVITALLNLLEDPNSDVRPFSIEALGEVGSDMATPKICALIEISDSIIRGKIAVALCKICSEEAISGLLKVKPYLEVDALQQIAFELGNTGSTTVISILLELIECADSETSWIAADSVRRIVNKVNKTDDEISRHLSKLRSLILTDFGNAAHHAIATIQSICKFYNYEIQQAKLRRADRTSPEGDRDNSSSSSTTIVHGDYIAGDKIGRDKILGNKTEAPNATEVKIFEQVENYYEIPPPTKDPSS